MLRDNYEQNVLLGNARAQQYSMLPVHQRLIHWLEERGELNRALEFLPRTPRSRSASANGLGLTSPEFSVLVAYAKLALKADLMPTALADDPWFQQTLTEYFPPQIQDEYATQLAAHPLRREIVINAVVNSDGQPGRDHLRLPGRGGPGRTRSRSRGRSSCAARCSG